MSAANHPERFPPDSTLKARMDRVDALKHLYKTEPRWTARPTYTMMPYDKPTYVVLGGLVIFGAYKLTSLVYAMFTRGIAENGHPSERQH